MKKIGSLCLSLVLASCCWAQSPVLKTDILTGKELVKIFSPAVKKEMGIQYPIFRVYRYTDKTGLFYTVLTESHDSIGAQRVRRAADTIHFRNNPASDTFNYKIQAITLKNSNGRLVNHWECNDFIDRNKKNEKTMTFWTKYAGFTDPDKDGIIDPLLVYGTVGMNHFDDGRVVIVIYHNGKKIYLRHQNAVLDAGRKLIVDKEFYALPQQLQNVVKTKMELISSNGNAIFPDDWQVAMTNKQTLITEQ